MTQNELDKLVEYINRSIGLSGGLGGRAAIEVAVRERARLRDRDRLDDYYERLSSDEGEVSRLVGALFESHDNFINYSWQFDALSGLLLDLVNRREERRLVLVSLGCGDGREAYALAMLAKESGLMNKDWAVDVYAVGLDGDGVETGRIGLYPGEAMGGLDRSRVQRWFRPKGSRFQARDELREMITWATVNPGQSREAWPWPELAGAVDVVLARGLPMELTPAAERRMVELCAEFVAPEGLLLTGPLETAAGALAHFEYERWGPVLYYRRSTEKFKANPGHVSRKQRAGKAAQEADAAVAEDHDWPEEILAELEAAAADLLRRRETAWRRLEEAAQMAADEGLVCAEALGLAARICMELGRWADARDQARRIIDLDGDRAWARLLLAEAYSGLGLGETAGEEAGRAADMLRSGLRGADELYFRLDPAWAGTDPLELATQLRPTTRRKQ